MNAQLGDVGIAYPPETAEARSAAVWVVDRAFAGHDCDREAIHVFGLEQPVAFTPCLLPDHAERVAVAREVMAILFEPVHLRRPH